MINVQDISTSLNVTDNTTILNFDYVITKLNVVLETYDSTWIYWAMVLDFFGHLAEDMY